MNLYRDGVFVHQADREWCVAAAVQNMLNVIQVGEEGRDPDVTAETQRAIDDRIVELTTSEDSHNGGTGPGGWACERARKVQRDRREKCRGDQRQPSIAPPSLADGTWARIR